MGGAKRDSGKAAALVTLHRYFIWADRMRWHFDQALRAVAGSREAYERSRLDIELYLSLWYAHLYVVVEGWRRLGLRDEAVDRLLTSSNLALLRKYRHGVCHFQEAYWDERLLGFIGEPSSAVWVRTLNAAIGDYLLKAVREMNKREG